MIVRFRSRPGFVSVRIRKWVLLGILSSVAVDGFAAESGYLPWEKGSVKIGGVVSSLDTTLTFNGASRPLKGEDDLGLDSTLTVFRAEVMFRPGQSLRHQIDFSYTGFHREGEATLSSAITIGNVNYPVGAQVQSVFNFDLARATYSYAILQTERIRLAPAAGIYFIPLKYGVQIQTAGGRSVVDGADAVVPLPELGLRGEFQLIPRLFLNAAV